jgi:hypothetical protein
MTLALVLLYRDNVSSTQAQQTDGNMNFLLASIAVASLAGAGISVILYPLEYCRVRLACDVTPKRAKRQFSVRQH